jgi:glycerate-2-kinase
VGDNLSTIGSGLTYFDESSFADAIAIIKKYSIFENRSDSMRNVSGALTRGLKTDEFETVKSREFKSLSVDNHIIGNNLMFCQKIAYHLKSRGYHVDYKGSEFNFSMNEFSSFTKLIFDQLQKDNTAVLMGGELTNVISKSKTGSGGRNQEAVCRMMELMDQLKNSDCSVICIGTDGIDGNSNSAGGILSPSTLKYLNLKKLNVNDFLESHNSNILLKGLHSTINTGYTGTNFNDVYLFVRKT